MPAVHVVNPGRKRKRKKSTTTTTTTKKKRRKRRATPNPAAANPKRKRRRKARSNPGRVRAAYTKSKDFLKTLDLKQLAKEAGAGLGADLLMGFVVKRFGDPMGQPAIVGGKSSPYAGSAWTMKNYAIAGGALLVAAWLGHKFKIPMAGLAWREGIKSLLKRGFYTEGIGRSEWAQNTFGSSMRVLDDGRGNRWVELPDGTQVAMAGLQDATPYGALVGADVYGALDDADEFYGAMDEDGGEIEVEDQASPGLVPARAIDAGGFDAPGLGRRYYPTPAGDAWANTYSRHSAFAPGRW